MRCKYCDYCDTERSIYNFSLIDPKGHKGRYVFVDYSKNEEVCNYCYIPQMKKGKT